MSSPCKEIERLVVSQKLIHPKNPVLTWCTANAVVQMDPPCNVKPSRNKSSEKIGSSVAISNGGGVPAASREGSFSRCPFTAPSVSSPHAHSYGGSGR